MTGCNPAFARFYVVLAAISLNFLAACGEDGDGNDDTLLTGFTGVIIFGIVAYVIYRFVKKRTQ